ncbi:hypothetical protein VBD025_06650 [Virgibacillus flavescens]|uniref:hypothetical protein n=1 Tax=Virgibacillus flavescens TaxID=1611422 RepID=UPI003D35009D
MVESMLGFMLGPMEVIGDIYFEYQIFFNTLVVGFALYNLIFRGKNKADSGSSAS